MTGSIFSQLAEEHSKSSDSSELKLGTWFALVDAFTVVERKLRIALHEEYSVTLPAFDTLMVLRGFPQGIRMSALAIKLSVTKGNVTSVARRLERTGWMTRQTPADDKRAQMLKLTPTGKRLANRMMVTYKRVVAEALDGLSEGQAQDLVKTLDRLSFLNEASP